MILMATEEDNYDEVIYEILMNAFMRLHAKRKVAEKIYFQVYLRV